MKISSILGLIVAIFGSALAGCCLPGMHCPGQYATQLQNATLRPMTDVGIRWNANGKEVRQEVAFFGSCVENGSGPYFDLCPEPIPETVMARWRTEDGNKHAKSVPVASRIPDIQSFTGDVVFKFYDDDVAIVPVPRWLEDRNSRLGKSTVP